MVELPSQPIADLDPEFETVALETGEFTWGLSGISVREKALLCLANDVCRSHLGLALRLHVQAALSHGVPYADLLALVRFIAPYAGYPASADVLAELGAIATELGVEAGSSASGVAPWQPTPGRGVTTTDPWLVDFVASRTARAWAETRLTEQERAYVALVSDVSGQSLGEPFRRHVRYALEAGAAADQVRDVLRFTAEFGVAKAAAALGELDSALDTDTQIQTG